MDRIPEPEYMDLAHEAEAYADADFADVNAAFVERLVALAGNVAEAVALDLGTGPADIPARVAATRPEWRIAAVDASFAMLGLGRSAVAGAPEVALVQADAKRLPYADETFDIVFSNSILHHVEDPVEFWSELRRVARPGAFVLLRDLHRPESMAAAERLVLDHARDESTLLQEEFYRSLLAAYTCEEVGEQLDAVGLDELLVEQITDRHLDVWGRVSSLR